MQIIAADKHVPIKTWIPWDDIEESAREQIRNVSNVPVVWPWVSIMPDVHAGMGSCIGTVIPMRGALIPASVGVDLGCGVLALKTSLSRDNFEGLDLKGLREEIEDEVPHGVGKQNSYDPLAFGVATKHAYWFDETFSQLRAILPENAKEVARLQVGSLGSGNHFIELCTDEKDAVWIMLHSGSRGLGHKLATFHTRVAKSLPHNADLPHRDLAYFKEGTNPFDAYWHDLQWAQKYATINRTTIMDRVLEVLARYFSVGMLDSVHCAHNYAVEKVFYGTRLFITRKGAISAGLHDFGIVPGSMGDKSYIVSGLANEESFHSAPHGAGRVMSRKKAKGTFALEDVERQTQGVECRKDKSVLDELPKAYKPIDEVMANSRTLVRPVNTLKQFLCVKG